MGRVPLGQILQKIESYGIIKLFESNVQVAYYSDQARIFVNAPSPDKTLVRVKEDIGRSTAGGTLVLRLSQH